MEKGPVSLSSNGYDFLESYTKQLYGERGTFSHNLRRFFDSDEFLNGCRNPVRIEDIPELNFDNIKDLIEQEKRFHDLSNNIMDVWEKKQKRGEMTTDDYYEIAGIMGLCPGHHGWYKTLFPHLVDLFVSSEEEGHEINENVKSQPNIVKIMVKVMSDGMRRGQIINYYGRCMWSQGYARNYFRGENAYNVQCQPSLYRRLPNDSAAAELHIIIGNLRMVEFSLWLNSISFIQKWPFGDVFHGAIAQHYGILTNGLDVTSDIKAAIFFACCRYENGSWRPLRPTEYYHKDSREEVVRRSGDSRYGILFAMPADISNMSRAVNISMLKLTGVTPIGFQPFMRCSIQSGYIIEAGRSYDLYKDLSFSKHKFRLSEDICEWIFNETDKGKKIYPNELFGTIEDIIETIKELNVFSKDAFEITIKNLSLENRSKTIMEDLMKKGFKIIPQIHPICTPERKKELEQHYCNAYTQQTNKLAPALIRPRITIY